jgi:hypothetical protein
MKWSNSSNFRQHDVVVASWTEIATIHRFSRLMRVPLKGLRQTNSFNPRIANNYKLRITQLEVAKDV